MKKTEYGDGFESIKGDRLNMYDDDNFDVDGTGQIPSRNIHSDADDKGLYEADSGDYGDNFDSQTGEDAKENMYDDDYEDSKEEYYINTTPSDRKNRRGNNRKKSQKKNGSNKKVSVILAVLAVLCLIAAVIFAVSQCSDEDGDSKATTAPTTKGSTAVQTTQPQYYETEAYTEPVETEAPTQIYTEEPTEVYTQPPTQAPETQAPTQTEPVVTEPQTEATEVTQIQQTTEVPVV